MKDFVAHSRRFLRKEQRTFAVRSIGSMNLVTNPSNSHYKDQGELEDQFISERQHESRIYTSVDRRVLFIAAELHQISNINTDAHFTAAMRCP